MAFTLFRTPARSFIFLLGILFSHLLAAQDWRFYRIDENVSLSIPFPIDSLFDNNTPIYSAQCATGRIIFSPVEKTRAELPTAIELRKWYGQFVAGAAASPGATLLDSAMIFRQSLMGYSYTLKANGPTGPVKIEGEIFLIKGKMYSFQFVEAFSDSTTQNPEKARFFENIAFNSSLTPKSQCRPSNPPLSYRVGYFVGVLLVIVFFLALVTGIVIFIIWRVRKSSRNKSPEQFF